jgi:hypothetical protein
MIGFLEQAQPGDGRNLAKFPRLDDLARPLDQ